jgi:hypothetical protein
MAKMATKIAIRQGHLEDLGGEFSINGYGAEQLFKNASQDKVLMTTWIGEGIADFRGRIGEIDKELEGKEGPAAEKLNATKQQLWGQLRGLQGAMKSVNTQFQTMEEFEKESAESGTTVGLTAKSTRKRDEFNEDQQRWYTIIERFNPNTQTWDIESKGPKYKTSTEERERDRLKRNRPMLENFGQQKGPMALYSAGYRMNEDGTLYKDPEGIPQKLQSWEKATGKRSNVKAIKAAGEQLDDSIEVMELLKDPQVQKDLKRVASKPGVLQRIGGMTVNSLRKFAQNRGIGANTKAYEALIRIQRMASDVRKELLGTAVTMTEVRSITGWLPDSRDNFESMVAKMNVGVHEATEGFKRWLDIFKDNANMAPYYNAFGWDRFNMPSAEKYKITTTNQREIVRTGTDPDTGRKVVEYSDGTIDYADRPK